MSCPIVRETWACQSLRPERACGEAHALRSRLPPTPQCRPQPSTPPHLPMAPADVYTVEAAACDTGYCPYSAGLLLTATMKTCFLVGLLVAFLAAAHSVQAQGEPCGRCSRVVKPTRHERAQCGNRAATCASQALERAINTGHAPHHTRQPPRAWF